MASYVGTNIVNQTLSTTVADTVELQGDWHVIDVLNRSTTDVLWVTAKTASVPSTATVAGDNVLPIMPGQRVTVLRNVPPTSAFLSLVGNSNPYSVIGAYPVK